MRLDQREFGIFLKLDQKAQVAALRCACPFLGSPGEVDVQQAGNALAHVEHQAVAHHRRVEIDDRVVPLRIDRADLRRKAGRRAGKHGHERQSAGLLKV